MKRKQCTAEELDRHQESFLSQAHQRKKLRTEARQIWESEYAHSTKHNLDRWNNLRNHTIKTEKDEDRAIGGEIIGALRTHLARLQGNRCCYCRRWLQNIAHARPIEHIFSRDDYPQFSIYYKNLAVACRDCNQEKSNKKWGSLSKAALEYPTVVDDFFHPRLHLFDGHVRYIRVETNSSSIAVYHGLTEQGRQICREHLKKISQVDALFKNNRHISEAIERLQAAGDVIDAKASRKLQEFIDFIHKGIHRIADKA
jgi:uncharacterized protein (TIGR02646 family)